MEIFLVMALLVVMSICDIKEKKLPLALVGLFVVLCLVLMLIKNEGFAIDMLYALIPGTFILLASIVTKGRIGIGDGIVLIGVGLFLGLSKTVLALLIGLALLSAIGIVLIIAKKLGKKSSLPFLPFLLVGVIVIEVIS